MTNREKTVYETLLKVYRGGYSGIELDEILRNVPSEQDRAYITRLFYGVLERDGTLVYAQNQLCARSPKESVAVLLKMGMYMISYMNIPIYAAIDKTVELSKRVGKGGVSGFINAVLRQYVGFRYPERGEVPDEVYLSVCSGAPEWLTKKIIGQSGYDIAHAMLTARLPEGTHIRRNVRQISAYDFEKALRNMNDLRPDIYNLGYYVTHSTMSKLDNCQFTPQALSSMLAVEYYLAAYGRSEGRALDVCAAPGGKSVYMTERGDFDVTACDKYPHRVRLIEAYAKRMGASVKTVCNDACVDNPSWHRRFDLVICDVPCSGFGVLSSKPDIAFNRTEAGIAAIAELQLHILQTSSAYVADDGILCYSTCTVTREENDQVVAAFLRESNFTLFSPPFACGHVEDGCLRLYPQDGLDGFFVAAFKRKTV